MSNIIHKVKDALTGHSDSTTDNTHNTTTGTTHRVGNSGVGAIHDTSDTGRTAGPHRSDVANKVDPLVDSDRDGSHTIGGTGKTAGVGGYGSHHGSTNYGPHNTNMGNKLDPTVDSDLDGSHHRATGGGAFTTGGFGTTGFGSGTAHYGTHGSTTTAGPHDSNLANKLDPRVDSDRDGSHNLGARDHTTGAGHYGTTGTGLTSTTGAYSSTHSTNAGPHDSNIANKLDPRVDSDRDGSHNIRARDYQTTGAGHYGATGTGLTSTGDAYGTHHQTGGVTAMGVPGTHHTSAGPHSSNLANKLDPRVDSDLDHRGTTHATGYGTTGYGNTSTGYGSTNAGPHDSNVANKLDPRVDSDRDHRATHGTGFGTTGHSTTTGYGSTNAGPHDSNVANKLDPRVDSDRDHRGPHGTAFGPVPTGHGTSTTHAGAPGYGAHGGPGITNTGAGHAATGPAPTTAGPHKSDMMNKLDPRVDSDLDGSKTIGGNKTFASIGSHHAD